MSVTISSLKSLGLNSTERKTVRHPLLLWELNEVKRLGAAPQSPLGV